MDSLNNKISLVDFGKLFFAICVVGIHTSAFSDNQIIHSYIFALAVPFFFVSSGFFLGRKISQTGNKSDYRSVLKQYGKRLLIPYVIWGCWYFLVEIAANKVTEGISIPKATINQFYRWLISSPGGGLWYVQVILILVLILMLSDKGICRIVLLIVALCLSMIPALVSSDNEWNALALKSHTVLWDGLYFLSGILLGEKRKKGLSLGSGSIAFVVGLTLMIVFDALDIDWFTRISKMITAVGLFCILLNISAPYSKERSIQLRGLSTIIYFTHITIKYGVQMAFKVLHIQESNAVFGISILILILFAIAAERYGKDNKVYKMLYSG